MPQSPGTKPGGPLTNFKPEKTDNHHLTYCVINTGSQFQSETAPGVSRSFIIRPTGLFKGMK